MKNYTHKSKYFYGNLISEYGLKNGYVDYRTLAKAFEGVLCNDITRLFYSEINGEYNEVEQVNGFIDNSEEIDEINEKINELLELGEDRTDEQEKRLKELEEKKEELQREEEPQEVYQYFIIDDNGAEILKDLTNEIVYYLPCLNVYVWGVTHWGTAWDYVLTDIEIELETEE
jgi:hypothetical protein